MSFISVDTLKAFASDNSFLTDGTTVDGVGEAIAQADEIIFQKTGVAIPSSPSEANAELRNIGCALVIWFTTGMQSKLEEQEINRRKKLYDDAMNRLNKIQSGEEPLKNSAGTVISSVNQTYFSSTQRITDVL